MEFKNHMFRRKFCLCLVAAFFFLLGLAAAVAELSHVQVVVAESISPRPAQPVATTSVPVTATTRLYLPVIHRAVGSMPPPLPPPTPIALMEPIDASAVRADLDGSGWDLAFNKIGFHHGMGGIAGDDPELIDMLTQLDAAGVPFFLKSADNAQPIYIAQELMKASGLSHTLVYRRVSGPQGNYDVPDYNKSPEAAAVEHWQKHMALFPPELDPSLVWLETINEVDKNRSEWLARFALKTAELALAGGYKWAAFGWSAGEPEPVHWQSPAMLQFLRLVAAHPDHLAIALHEYSYTTDEIGLWYPHLVGRFQTLFQVCDQYGIARPTVLITEWGWTYREVPDEARAMADIAWASWLYAAHPQVKGAAIWYLGGGDFGEIYEQTRRLIEPVRQYSLHNYFIVRSGQGAIDTSLFRPTPPVP